MNIIVNLARRRGVGRSLAREEEDGKRNVQNR